MEKTLKILIVAGEPSGDTHAAELVDQLKKLSPGAEFFGAGGPKLKAAGVSLTYDLTSIAVVGFMEVLKNLPTFRKVFAALLAETDRRRPDLAVLVDYPGFNLRLAAELKKRGIPVVYYISPQIWAWGKERIGQIKRDIGTMLVILPFEEKIYRDAGVDASFVGHPALDHVKPGSARKPFLENAGLDSEKLTVSLLPGSREKEVRNLLPVMLKTASIIESYMSGKVQFLILRSPSVSEELFRQATAKAKLSRGLKLATVTGATYDGIAASDFCLVCSGTATLETGILGTPMAILYKVNLLTWLYMRVMIRIPFIGLVNIVTGRKVVEEFIQYDCDPWKIADHVLRFLRDPARLGGVRKELAQLRLSLGEPGASRRAAEKVLDFAQLGAYPRNSCAQAQHRRS